MSEYHYSIQPYRWSVESEAWTQASEAEATVWFAFRRRGEDHHCFGVFPRRKDAERAMQKMKAREREQALAGRSRI